MTDLTDDEFQKRARAYIQKNMRSKGGLKEAWRAFWGKTFPLFLGTDIRPSVWQVLSLLGSLILLTAAAAMPLLIRRVTEIRTGTVVNSSDVLLSAVRHFDAIDLALAMAVVALNFGVKFFDAASKKKPGSDKGLPPLKDFCAAINRMPAFVPGVAADESVGLVLEALKVELSHLIGEEDPKQLVDITLLEYSNPSGIQMHVRVRTAVHEDTLRPILAWRLMADYVAKEGRWFVEHDFLSPDNPFPKVRLSVTGKPKINYRSVLFLPIYVAEIVDRDSEYDGRVTPIKKSNDQCIGVICAHSSKPYRFWRWGDQNKEMGGFGNVAYERSLPYITLVRRLREPSAHRVAVETL